MNLDQFANTLKRLQEMLAQHQQADELPDLLQDAVEESLLQRFEYTIEVAWKSTKRYLVEVEGYDSAMGPKTVLRVA
ncbi:MAG: nucleotidyltransferase substrate binding protein [Anaerolineales bacterium]|nr:nucleotidyltransferase substrate binding protein [Anaerolineales bacterium]